MTPESDADLKVKETHSVNFYDDQGQLKEGPLPEDKTIKCGTRNNEMEFTVPPDAAGRRVQLVFKVARDSVSDQKSQETSIVKQQASLPTALRHNGFTM
jgi:hypothetical protein